MILFPSSKAITLTETGSSTAINIMAARIQRIDTDGSGSCLLITGLHDSVRTEKLYVTQTPAAVAALTGIHVQLTNYVGGLSFYISALCFRELFDETTYRVACVTYGGDISKFKVTQSLAVLQAAINAATNIPSGNILSIPLAGTTQGDATLIPNADGEPTFVTLTDATTPATAAGAILAASTIKGTQVTLYNPDPSFAALLYPSTGFNIDGLAADAAFTIPAASAVTLTLAGANAWLSSFVQSTQDVRAAGTGVTGDAAPFLVSPDRLNIVHLTNASGAGNGIRPIASNSDGGSILYINQSSTLGGQAFPPTGQDYGLGVDTPIMVPPLGSVLVVQPTAGNWRIVYGYNLAVQSGTASTTQTQAAGTLIHQPAVNMTTVANAGDAYTISRALREFVATNATANAAQVFPPSGGTIDALGANASCTVYPGSVLVFTSNNGLAWKLSGTRVAAATLAAGAATVSDTNIRATSSANVQRLAVLGTIVSVHLLPTITAGTNVVVQSKDIAAVNDATDVSTIRVIINY